MLVGFSVINHPAIGVPVQETLKSGNVGSHKPVGFHPHQQIVPYKHRNQPVGFYTRGDPQMGVNVLVGGRNGQAPILIPGGGKAKPTVTFNVRVWGQKRGLLES